MSARDHVGLAAAALAVVVLLAAGAHRVMRWAVPNGAAGLAILVRR